MTPAELVAWAEAQEAAGRRDALGRPFTAWMLARFNPDGTAMRDARGNQIYETYAEFKARHCPAPFIPPVPATGQNLSLF